MGRAEYVQHAAIGGGASRHLRIYGSGIETLVNGIHIAEDECLEPAFGIEAPRKVIARALRIAHLAYASDQANEPLCILIAEYLFLGPHAEDDFCRVMSGL